MSYLRCYDLQYKVIPSLVNRLSDIGLDNITDINELKKILIGAGYDRCEIDLDAIQISTYMPSRGIMCVLYEYPDPFRVPLAKYSLVVIDKTGKQKKVRYFTWELTDNFDGFFDGLLARINNQEVPEKGEPSFKWTLGEKQEDEHINYGTWNEEERTKEAFIRAVFKMCYDLDNIVTVPVVIKKKSNWPIIALILFVILWVVRLCLRFF